MRKLEQKTRDRIAVAVLISENAREDCYVVFVGEQERLGVTYHRVTREAVKTALSEAQRIGAVNVYAQRIPPGECDCQNGKRIRLEREVIRP